MNDDQVRPPLPPADDDDAGPALAGVGFDPDDKAAEAIARVINNRVRSNLARDRRLNAAVTQHIAEAIEATVLEAVADGLPQIERAIVRYHTLTRSSIERRRLDAIKARQAARTSAAIEELDALQ